MLAYALYGEAQRAGIVVQPPRKYDFRPTEERAATPVTSARTMNGKGSEAPVELAFKRWLEAEGWTLIDEPGSWAEVIAERGDERLIGEVKGHTGSSTGSTWTPCSVNSCGG